MDNELAARVISLQQQAIDFQQEIIKIIEDLYIARHHGLTLWAMLEKFQSANYEFSGIIEKIRKQNHDTIFVVIAGDKRNRYIWDTRQFLAAGIYEGMAVLVTANVMRIVSRRTSNQLDGFLYCLPVETIRKI